MSKYQYAVLFELQEGGFKVIVPAIPEIRTFGETMQAARVTARFRKMPSQLKNA